MRKIKPESIQQSGKPGETLDSDAAKILQYMVRCLDEATFWKTPQCLPAVVGASQAWLLVYLIDQQIYWLGSKAPKKMAIFPCKTKNIRLFTGLSDGTISTCMKDLERDGLIKTRVAGLPPVRYVQVNMRAVFDKVAAYQKEVQDEFDRRDREAEKRSNRISNNAISELLEIQNIERINQEQVYLELVDQDQKGTVTSYRDEGPSGASSPDGFADAPGVGNATPAQVTKEQPTPANESRQATPPAYSRKSKPRHKPAPLPAHPAIPFMQTLAKVLEPILANKAHATYPQEGDMAYKYHLDALEAYDAIQTGAILARPLSKPERYASQVPWGNPYRLERLKLWSKDHAAMENDLLAAARIYAASREHNLTVARLPSVAAFLFGATPEGGFLPWWNFVKPAEAMEAKEKKVLAQAAGVPRMQERYIEMEAKGHIERNSFEHKRFLKLFGREPNTLKEKK